MSWAPMRWAGMADIPHGSQPYVYLSGCPIEFRLNRHIIRQTKFKLCSVFRVPRHSTLVLVTEVYSWTFRVQRGNVTNPTPSNLLDSNPAAPSRLIATPPALSAAPSSTTTLGPRWTTCLATYKLAAASPVPINRREFLNLPSHDTV